MTRGQPLRRIRPLNLIRDKQARRKQVPLNRVLGKLPRQARRKQVPSLRQVPTGRQGKIRRKRQHLLRLLQRLRIKNQRRISLKKKDPG